MSTNTNELTKNAMLVDLYIGSWAGQKVDRTITEEVLTNKEAERDAGRFTKNTVPKEELKALNANTSQLRAMHYHFTLPWMNDGARILPVTLYPQYKKRVAELVREREELVEDFISNRYPKIKANAKKRLGRLFSNDDFPAPETLRSRFRVNPRVFPVPSSDDFRVKLSAKERDKVKQEMNKQISATVSDSVMEAYRRVHKQLSRLQERLADKEAVFRDSLITNIKELADILPAFNITGDPELEKLAQELKDRFASRDPSALREDKSLRNRTALAAKKKLKELDDKLGLSL